MKNHVVNDIAKLAGGLFQGAMGVKDHLQTTIKHRVEQQLNRYDLVYREEFDVMRSMLNAALEEQKRLKERIEELEKQL